MDVANICTMLHRSITHSTAFERLRATENSRATFEGRVQKTLDGAIRNLEGMSRRLDLHHMATLADRFCAAERITSSEATWR